MRRVLVVVLATLALAVPATAAAPKLFQGWTGGSDVVSHGGSVQLSDGGSLLIDPGCANLQDSTTAPTHGVTICNWGVRVVDYGPPLARSMIVAGSADPTATVVTFGGIVPDAGSLYMRSLTDGTGQAYFKTGACDFCWTKVAG